MIVGWGEGQSQRKKALRAPRPWCGCRPLLGSPLPVSAPARPTVRGCGWGEGGAGSSEARAAVVRGEGERRERGEGEGRDRLGVWCSAPLLPAPRPHPWQPLLQLRVTSRTTSSLPRPPLRPGLCGRRRPSQTTGGPVWVWIWVWMGPAEEGVAVTRCPLCSSSTALRRPLLLHPLWGHWKTELRPAPCA